MDRTPDLGERQLLLLERIVRRRAPALRGLSEAASSGVLAVEDREALREVVASELCEAGLDDSDEPNAYGLVLESLIDALAAES